MLTLSFLLRIALCTKPPIPLVGEVGLDVVIRFWALDMVRPRWGDSVMAVGSRDGLENRVCSFWTSENDATLMGLLVDLTGEGGSLGAAAGDSTTPTRSCEAERAALFSAATVDSGRLREAGRLCQDMVFDLEGMAALGDGLGFGGEAGEDGDMLDIVGGSGGGVVDREMTLEGVPSRVDRESGLDLSGDKERSLSFTVSICPFETPPLLLPVFDSPILRAILSSRSWII